MILFRQRALSVPVCRATPVSSSPDPITIVLASLGLPVISLSPPRALLPTLLHQPTAHRYESRVLVHSKGFDAFTVRARRMVRLCLFQNEE